MAAVCLKCTLFVSAHAENNNTTNAIEMQQRLAPILC